MFEQNGYRWVRMPDGGYIRSDKIIGVGRATTPNGQPMVGMVGLIVEGLPPIVIKGEPITVLAAIDPSGITGGDLALSEPKSSGLKITS